MSSSENDLRLPYTELTKIENEHNWRIARLLIGLSAGILAFSLQTFDNNATYDLIIYASIYFSWVLLFISFGSGLLNVHLFQKILSNASRKTKAKEAKDPNVIVIEEYEKTIDFFKNINTPVSYIFRISFMMGVIAFLIFKVSVVTSSDPIITLSVAGIFILMFLGLYVIALKKLKIKLTLKDQEHSFWIWDKYLKGLSIISVIIVAAIIFLIIYLTKT